MLKQMMKLYAFLKKANKRKYYYLYRIFHYVGIKVPFKAARHIAEINCNRSFMYDFSLETLDGSNQASHPDFIYFHNQYWLAFTPYPYGMTEYEQPCVYRNETLADICRNVCAPVDTSKTRRYKCNLSAPCIAANKDSVICYYRESARYKSGLVRNSLFYSEFDFKSNAWNTPKQIRIRNANQFLSPAIINIESDTYCYYAEFDNVNSGLFCARITDGQFNNNKKIQCNGLDKSFDIWRMSIVFKDSLCKYGSAKTELCGIFLVRSHDSSSVCKLYNAYSPGVYREWYITNEISLPAEIKKNIKTLCKSCYIPNTNKILINYRDNKDIYRLAAIDRV